MRALNGHPVFWQYETHGHYVHREPIPSLIHSRSTLGLEHISSQKRDAGWRVEINKGYGAAADSITSVPGHRIILFYQDATLYIPHSVSVNILAMALRTSISCHQPTQAQNTQLFYSCATSRQMRLPGSICSMLSPSSCGASWQSKPYLLPDNTLLYI